MRSIALSFLFPIAASAFGQPGTNPVPGQFVISEDIGLSMNRSQVMAAAQDAWGASFGQEPGGRLTLVDIENGLMEGTTDLG